MFNRRNFNETNELDKTISSMIQAFADLDDGSDEQATAAQALKTMIEARTTDMEVRRAPIIDPNVLVSAAASLAGIIAILGFEKANVITSKGLAFIPKIRL